MIPRALEILAIASGAGLVVWLLLLLNTYLSTRPRRPSRGQRVSGALVTMVLGVLVTAPMATTSYYAMTQRSTLDAIVTNEHTATAPTLVHRTRANPWGTKKRVNVLLLGGDGGVGRTGIRTDTVILLSMDTRTGRTVMFSLPRNLRNVPFPSVQPARRSSTPTGSTSRARRSGESMLNAIYRNVPAAHPGVLGRSDNEGADAVKQGVSGALGHPGRLLPAGQPRRLLQDRRRDRRDHRQRQRAGRDQRRDRRRTSRRPAGSSPGPAQHLDGFHALWFTRGRYGSTDYKRMERQRCAIHAIVDEASPAKLLARYTQLASASRQILRTDIPQSVLPAFVDLALKMKQQPLTLGGLPALAGLRPQRPRLRHRALGGAARAAPGAERGHGRRRPTAADRSAGAVARTGADSRNVDATDAAADCTYQPVSAGPRSRSVDRPGSPRGSRACPESSST